MQSICNDSEESVIAAVTDYFKHQRSGLIWSNIADILADDELVWLQRNEDGEPEFTVEDVRNIKKEEQDNVTIWYVGGSLYFDVDWGEHIEGSANIYRCYQRFDPHLKKQVWHIEWHRLYR